MRILKNPSPESFAGLQRRAEYGGIRAIVTDEGDLFAWAGSSATHAEVSEDHAIYGTRLDIFKTTVTVVLAGGALELLDSPEKLKDFMSSHGHPDADIDDVKVLEAICDKETARIRANLNMARVLPDLDDLRADIDPRIDWTAATLAMIRDYTSERPQLA